MKRSKLLASALILLVAFCQVAPLQAAAAANQPEVKTKTPIKHLIFVMQENHTFDNYFGTYPGADGIPANTKMPVDPANPQAGYVTPWHIGETTITDLSHNTKSIQAQLNGGKMDGFVSGLNVLRENGRTAMGYYDDRDIPYYWNLADHYVLFDRFFSSAPAGSFENHVYSVIAQAPPTETPLLAATQMNAMPTIFDRL